MNYISITSSFTSFPADLCTLKPVILLLIKWNPLIRVVLQWKLTEPRKFGLNKIQLFLPAVQICELTVHLEISITCYAVAAYALILKTTFKEQARSAVTHVDLHPKIIIFSSQAAAVAYLHGWLFRFNWPLQN
jgi:hypothetical protein